MALLLLLGAMASAHAQMGGGHGRRQNNQQQTPQQSPAPTTPFLPEIWPRLEEGDEHHRSSQDENELDFVSVPMALTRPGAGA